MKKNLSGFTLIEIIIVIVIIGVIASAGFPKFFSTFERTKSAEGKQILLSVLNAQKIYYLEHGVYSELDDLSELDISIPNSANFSNITISSNTSRIATIDRTGLYTLRIKSDGIFTCGDIAAGACSKIGFPST